MARGRAGTGSNGGLDALIGEIGQRLGESLGQAIAAGIMQGVQASGLNEAGLGGRRRPGRPPRAAAAGASAEGKPACLVPNCGRPGVAKGLCATHYRKARRLKMGDTFNQSQLDELAQDARKTRFQKG